MLKKVSVAILSIINALFMTAFANELPLVLEKREFNLREACLNTMSVEWSENKDELKASCTYIDESLSSGNLVKIYDASEKVLERVGGYSYSPVSFKVFKNGFMLELYLDTDRFFSSEIEKLAEDASNKEAVLSYAIKKISSHEIKNDILEIYVSMPKAE